MERFQELRAVADRKLHVADHMLTMTYPFIQDPKILIAVTENLFLALTNAMSSLLYYERLFKKIPPFQDNFTSKFNMFKENCVVRHNISQDYLKLMKDIRDILVAHRESPVEFSKKDRFVICSNDYEMKTISLDGIKEYVKKTKLFIHLVNNITTKNESIFK
ncbi:MAG: hypothetical protein ABIJ08_03685 [Nanoarchaeota archaeon]